jgi:hypothetical protein
MPSTTIAILFPSLLFSAGAQSAPLCSRSLGVVEAIESFFQQDCDEISLEKLEMITHLKIRRSSVLKEGDFENFGGLKKIKIENSFLQFESDEIFSNLPQLRRISF